eukprot:4544072-Amphidinium_carterae.1
MLRQALGFNMELSDLTKSIDTQAMSNLKIKHTCDFLLSGSSAFTQDICGSTDAPESDPQALLDTLGRRTAADFMQC